MILDKTIKILVAEDEDLISEYIIIGLKVQGYVNIIKAVDGEDAYEKACSLQPDVILMDLMMPKLNGIEAAYKIQECCSTPIVIISAHDSSDSLINAGAAGVSAFLTKPAQPDDIERAMVIAMARHADLMEMRRLNKELELALEEVKKLQGILPICANCKNIRDDKGYWQQIEAYIEDHSEAEFSHGFCPDCAKKLYPDYFKGNIEE